MSISWSPHRPEPAAPCQPSSSVDSTGDLNLDPYNPGLVFPENRSSLLARRLLRLRACRSHGPVPRRKREMIPPDKKDATYWDKRHKNNEAAKRSREKRRMSDLMMEGRLVALSDENAQLRAQVLSLQYHNSMQRSKVAPAEAPTAAFFQVGLCLPHVDQERAIHTFEAGSPRFSSMRGVDSFEPQSFHGCGTQSVLLPLPGPLIHSQRAVLEGMGSAEAEKEAQRQISSSDDIPCVTKASGEFLPKPDSLPHASARSYPPPNWLVPHVEQAVMCRPNNFLLPWWSSYVPPPAVYPAPPLCILQDKQGLNLEANIRKGL
ncbi:uncharacterized protein V6R79_011514 [Siganus canaliculatus]